MRGSDAKRDRVRADRGPGAIRAVTGCGEPKRRIKNVWSVLRQKAAAAVKSFVKWRDGITGRMSKPQRVVCRILSTVVCITLAFLFVLYGPFTALTDLYITTAMRTSDHQYLATMFYSDEYISRVLARNSVGEMEGLSAYTPSEYCGSDRIELTELSGYGQNGYMLTIYDESRIRLAASASQEGELLEHIARRNGAAAGINASGYSSNANKSRPNGFAMYDGKVTGETDERKRSFVALDYYGHLYMGSLFTSEIMDAGFKDVVEFGPLLILNGEPCDISGNGGGLAPRTAIGITADRRVLLLVLEGRSGLDFGASLRTVQEIMLEFGAVNALNLDGGFSSSMYYDGELISSSAAAMERMLPNAILVSG